MNNSTTIASERTGTVTASVLLSALRGCYSAGLHGEAVYDRPEWSDSFTFKVRATFKPIKGPETSKEVTVPGYVTNGYVNSKDRSGVYRPTEGFWWLFGAMDRVIDALELLPRDAVVSFAVLLGWGTNGALEEVNMHGDCLYLVAQCKRGKGTIERRILLDTSCGPHNTARFGYAR